MPLRATRLAGYDLVELRPLWSTAAEKLTEGLPVSITASEAGRAYLAQSPVTVPHGAKLQAFIPVTLRDERMGVLSVVLPQPVDAETLLGLQGITVVLAYVVLAAGRYTDLFEVARRRKALSLEAEVQWGLQPVRAFGCDEFSRAGQLVPAYDVGGDSYDWVVNYDTASVSATDAMGHGLNASMLGSLAVTAIGRSRRRAVNAGHPRPVRIRGGWASAVELDAQLPIGLFEATTYRHQPLELRSGDRLVLVSDGVVEATPKGGPEFGDTRLEAALLATAEASPHEAVRQLVRTLTDYHQGEQRDDATILILDWRGRGA